MSKELEKINSLNTEISSTYLDMLLASESLSDFISKYYLVELLAEYDQELLEKIENTKKTN